MNDLISTGEKDLIAVKWEYIRVARPLRTCTTSPPLLVGILSPHCSDRKRELL